MALTTAFARNGNRKAVPQTTADGSVSYEQGFGNLYALPPEEGGLFIDRAQFNQIMYDTTSAVISNQTSINTLNSKVTANQNSINTLNSKVADLESGVSTGVVNLTGNQTIGGVKTFSSPPVSATNPTANNQVANKAYVDTVGNTAVKLTGNQTIAGTKTFSSPVVVPDATATTHAVNLAQLNTKANWNAVVNLTDNQSIAGAKTFTSNITAPNITTMQNSINTINGKISNLESKASTGVNYIKQNINWRIGPGGDYETIAEALVSAKKYNSRADRNIGLNLNADYAGGEDLTIFSGDYSNVIINGGENRFEFNTFFVKIFNLNIRFANINIINANQTAIEINNCPHVRIDNLKIHTQTALPLSVLSSRVVIVGDTCTLTTTNANVIFAQSAIIHLRADGTFSSTSQNFSLVLGSIVSSQSPATANIAKNTPTANGLFLN